MTLSVQARVKLVKDKTVYFQGCDGVSKLGMVFAEGSFGHITEVRQSHSIVAGDVVTVIESLVKFRLPAIGMVFEILCASHEIEQMGKG